jgi:hypothetical protein
VQGVRGECADECAGDLTEATLEFNGGVGLGCRDSLCKSMGIRAELKHVIALPKPTCGSAAVVVTRQLAGSGGLNSRTRWVCYLSLFV